MYWEEQSFFFINQNLHFPTSQIKLYMNSYLYMALVKLWIIPSVIAQPDLNYIQFIFVLL